MQSAKNLENLALIFWLDADAVVVHKDFNALFWRWLPAMSPLTQTRPRLRKYKNLN